MKNLKLKIQGFLLLLAVAAFSFLPEQVGAQDTPGFISVTVKSGRDTLPVYVSVGDFRWAVADGTGSLIMYGNKIKTLKVLEDIEALNDVAALYCGRITAVILTNGNGILLGNKFVSDVRTSGSGSVITMSGVQETFKSSQSMSTVLSNIECATPTVTASNGLRKYNGNIKLGASLDTVTTIEAATYRFSLGQTTSSVLSGLVLNSGNSTYPNYMGNLFSNFYYNPTTRAVGIHTSSTTTANTYDFDISSDYSSILHRNAGGTLTSGIFFSSADNSVALVGSSSILFSTSKDNIQSKIVILLPTYANNAAALAGGLTATMLYKTSTGEVRIVI